MDSLFAPINRLTLEELKAVGSIQLQIFFPGHALKVAYAFLGIGNITQISKGSTVILRLGYQMISFVHMSMT